MRSLILFRHGKSDWDAAFHNDHERPLSSRGKDTAKTMGRMLTQIGQTPQLAVSSSALRARDTLHLAAGAGRWPCHMQIESALYETSPTAVVNWLITLRENPACLLLTGHEPAWSGLASRLIGEATIKVPTGSMLRIDLDLESWQEIRFGRGQLRWLLPPKLVCRMMPGA